LRRDGLHTSGFGTFGNPIAHVAPRRQLEGWRRVEATDRHAAVDYAKVLKDLSDAHFPASEKIAPVH
jgi:hypothetical protein